jgi:hypothetical protein
MKTPTLEQLLDLAIASRLREVWTSLPARVVSAQVAGGPVDLQLLPGDFQDGIAVPLPILGSVPVGYPAASGGGIRYSLDIGDLVLVVFACRPIGGLEQGGFATELQDTRTHSLSDPFCLPLAVFGAPTAIYKPIALNGDGASLTAAWIFWFNAVASVLGIALPTSPVIATVTATSTVEAT